MQNRTATTTPSTSSSSDSARSRKSSTDGSSFRHDPYASAVLLHESDDWDNTTPTSPHEGAQPPAAYSRPRGGSRHSFHFSPFPSRTGTPSPVAPHLANITPTAPMAVMPATPPRTVSPVQPLSMASPPFQTPVYVPMPAMDPVRAALAHHCSFIELPLYCQGIIQRDKDAPRRNALFVGQVKYEATPEQIAFVFKTLAGAVPTRVSTRGRGCYALTFLTEDDASRAKTLNGCVVWDLTGLWFAPSEVARVALVEYLERTNAERSALRLPRDAMVVRK